MLTAVEANRLEQIEQRSPALVGPARCVRCDLRRPLSDRLGGGQMCPDCQREAGHLVPQGLCVSCEMPVADQQRTAGQIVCAKCDLSEC
jgi:hypothetical protein